MIQGSYRTYEEWKLPSIPFWSAYNRLVLTVPMRNGNAQNNQKHTKPARFLPYLWGMETEHYVNSKSKKCKRSYRTYEEWKPSYTPSIFITSTQFLPYLWGMETWQAREWQDALCCQFLPYLWGMETGKDNGVPGTYIFWFLPYLWGMETRSSCNIVSTGTIRSYRTYEEWKLWTTPSTATTFLCSYRTYEEWKLGESIKAKQWRLVLTVPMRNGNLLW